MKKQYGILVDLDRCVGCFACEIACEQANSFKPGGPWIRVHTVGPKMVNGKLRMDYIPLISRDCKYPSCGENPSCVVHCPTKAMKVCSPVLMLDALGSRGRYQVCTIVQTGE